MTDEIKEVKEITEVTVKEETETPTEVEAQIAVAKAEATVQRAEDAVAVIEATAQMQVAQVAIEAEQQIAEHEEKVIELEYDVKWQNETIRYLQDLTEKLVTKVEALELKLSTPTALTDSQAIPQTVEVVEIQSGGEGDPQAQHENPIAEIVEAVETAPQKVKRKIRAI